MGGVAPTNLVLSHRLRETINKRLNEADRQGKEAEQFTLAEFGLEAVSNMNCPQDAWFWVGQRVVACSKGRKLRNGREYEIMELGKTVQVQAEGEDPVVLKRAEFFMHMRLRYAVTYASAQGLTIEGLLALHDTSHQYFTWKHLYVGMSRARGRDKLIVY